MIQNLSTQQKHGKIDLTPKKVETNTKIITRVYLVEIRFAMKYDI